MLSRKKIVYLVIIFLLFSFLISSPFLFDEKIFVNDDFLFHKNRLLAYYSSVVIDGNFHPMIFQNMAMGYGYAADLFYPSLLLFPFVILHYVGFSIVLSYNLLIVFYSFVTLVVSYGSAYFLFRNERMAFLTSISYAFGTYRLIDIFIRGDLGEVIAYSFLPLVILGLYMVFKKYRFGISILAVGFALVALSHLMTTFLCIYVVIGLNIYLCIRKMNSIWFIKKQILGYCIAILLAAMVVFPIVEQMFSEKLVFMKHMPLWPIGLNFSLSKLVEGSLANASGIWNNESPNIGPILLIIIIVAFFSKKRSGLQWNLLWITVFFLVISTNLFLWPMLSNTWFSNIQFEWRLLIFVTLFGSLLLALVMNKDSKYYYSLITVIIVLAMSFNYSVKNNFQTNPTIIKVTEDNINTVGSDTVIGGGLDYLPQGVKYDNLANEYSKLTSNKNVVITDEGNNEFSTPLSKNNVYENPRLGKNDIMVFPQFFYKGYVLEAYNGEFIPTYNYHGFVAVKGPINKRIRLLYKQTTIQSYSIAISEYSWILYFVYLYLAVNVRKKDLNRFKI